MKQKNIRILSTAAAVLLPKAGTMTSPDSATKKKKQKHGKSEAGTTSTPPETQESSFSTLIRAQVVPILIFLFTLFFIMTFSNPALFLNDEWITVNQLHQLDQGMQVTVNEGKYGTFINGTPAPYFEARHNLLGYTMMLPVLSLPILKFFWLFGDQFRAIIVLLWSILPVAMALLIDAYRPEWARWKGIRWTWGVIGVAFVALLTNLLFYSAWPFTAIDAPREAAAVVFTNHILFALTAMMIFLTCRTIFKDTWFSVFGTLACVSCSSYIFWAANAKDHMLVAAMLAAVILFLVRYICYRSQRDAALAFVAVGLLAWARPEVGMTVFIAAAAVYLWLAAGNTTIRRGDIRQSLCALTAPLWTLIGAVPLFINNVVVTGNPLVPAFWVYEKRLVASAAANGAGGEVIGSAIQSVPAPEGGIAGFIAVVTNHFTPNLATLPTDVFGILFAPASGNMSLIAVCPLILIALVALPVIWWYRREQFSPTDTRIIVVLAAIGIAIWAAYLRSIPGLNASTGIVPDIRYLVPFYLPAGLLGVYAIRAVTQKGDEQTLARGTIGCIIIGLPLFIGFIATVQPFGGLYAGYTLFFRYTVFILLALSLCMMYLVSINRVSKKALIATLGILFAAPFAWQIMMVFLYSISKFNGYPLWIPIIEELFNTFVQVKDVSP